MATILITVFLLDGLSDIFTSFPFIAIMVVIMVGLMVYVAYKAWGEWNGDWPEQSQPNKPKKQRLPSNVQDMMDRLDRHRAEIDSLKTRVWRLENPRQKYEPRPMTMTGGLSQTTSSSESSKGVADAWSRERHNNAELSRRRDYEKTDYGSQYQGFVQGEPETEALCRLYNEAVNDSNKRNRFRETYRITRISTTNVDERRRDPKAKAVFETSSGGEFYIIEIHLHGRSVFAAVPHFDVEINDLSYVHGAAGQVFECRGYEPGGIYRPVRVTRPALFQEAGTNWILVSPGELEVTKVSR